MPHFVSGCGLGLKGMAGAFDEAVTTGVQRQRTINEILTDLLRAEVTHRRSPHELAHGVGAMPPRPATG